MEMQQCHSNERIIVDDENFSEWDEMRGSKFDADRLRSKRSVEGNHIIYDDCIDVGSVHI